MFRVVGLINFATVTYQVGRYGKTRARSGASPTKPSSTASQGRQKLKTERVGRAIVSGARFEFVIETGRFKQGDKWSGKIGVVRT